jgi:hypothetical protein
MCYARRWFMVSVLLAAGSAEVASVLGAAGASSGCSSLRYGCGTHVAAGTECCGSELFAVFGDRPKQ